MNMDLLQEANDLLRRERMTALWHRYGGAVLTALVAIILAVGLWEAWRAWDMNVREAQTGAYLSAAEDSNDSLLQAASDMRPELRGLAFLSAGATDKVIEDKDISQDLRELALLTRPDSTAIQLQAIAQRQKSPWREQAIMAQALTAAHREKPDYAAAKVFLADIISNQNLPTTLRGRAEALNHLYTLQMAKKETK